ncbi:MFS general substrate transporter [Lojkania enalia]|uniref:MFS general substrate transporter n=1 Tax=Lojkania enalia TaxID=147567 RepID=A0A9P4K7T5_9PLEO|nr:MFS general substrate transporter [Didymosphaeria enalia]
MNSANIELSIQSAPTPQDTTTPDADWNSQHQFDLGDSTEFALPPVDRGKDAWGFLAAAFTIECLVWGFPFAYGIFQTTTVRTSHSQDLETLPSLAHNVTHLIVTQGVFYAIGGGLVYSPVIQFMDEWFVRRKGLAFGVMWAGTGIGGVLIPLLLEYLLNNHGFRTTLRIWSIILFLLTAPLLYFLKPRLPIPQSQSSFTRRFDLSFLKDRTFLILQAGNVLEGLGYFVPSIYLPTIATRLGASSSVSSLTVILLNIASVFGCVAMGSIIDRWHVTTCILVSTIGSTGSIFLVWGLSTSLPPLFVFCVMYGLFAGSFSSTYPGIRMAVQESVGRADVSMVLALLSAGRGIGNVICGPASEGLARLGVWRAAGTYGTEYGPLVLFTGISAALGGVGVLGRRVGWM